MCECVGVSEWVGGCWFGECVCMCVCARACVCMYTYNCTVHTLYLYTIDLYSSGQNKSHISFLCDGRCTMQSFYKNNIKTMICFTLSYVLTTFCELRNSV